MMGIFTITEKNYLMVSLLQDLVRPLLYFKVGCICGNKLFGCAICLVFGIATKRLLLAYIYLPYFTRRLSG